MTGAAPEAAGRNLRGIALGGFLLVAAAFAYSHFFVEGLPWFWFDDVDRIERAERTGWAELARQTFDLASPDFGTERPVLQAFVKLSLALFGEDAHRLRMLKLAFFLAALAALYLLLARNGVRPAIAAGGLFLAATWPSVMIVTSWACESAALELFFKVGALALFFVLARREGEGAGGRLRTGAACALLLLLVVLADHAKATAKVLPAVFLSTLLLGRSRQAHLYAVAGLALAAVFPYSVLLGHGVPAVSKGSHLPALLFNFGRQAGWLAPAAILGAAAAGRRALSESLLLRLLFCWWACETAFCALYPTGELRYLYGSLASFTAFGTALVGAGAGSVDRRSLGRGAVAAFCLLSLAALAVNTRWNDSFRGSWGGFLAMADRKMRYVNAHYRNSIVLYVDYSLPYYDHGSTNRYVNINPVNSWGMRFDNLVVVVADAVYVMDRYEHVLADVSVPQATVAPIGLFPGIVEGSLWDRLHDRYAIPLWKAKLYDLDLKEPEEYPIVGTVNEVKGPKIDLVPMR